MQCSCGNGEYMGLYFEGVLLGREVFYAPKLGAVLWSDGGVLICVLVIATASLA